MRDPRNDPQAGDVIRQQSGDLVKVTHREGDSVSWVSKTPKGKVWKNANSWTLGGWRNNVCHRSVVEESK